jgi:hypothetical protein
MSIGAVPEGRCSQLRARGWPEDAAAEWARSVFFPRRPDRRAPRQPCREHVRAGINEPGPIVGEAVIDGNPHAVLWNLQGWVAWAPARPSAHRILGRMSFFPRKSEIVTPEQALPGRDTPIPVTRHLVLVPPFPAGSEQLVVGMGCFWGADRPF